MGRGRWDLGFILNGLPWVFNSFWDFLCCLGEVGRCIILNFVYGMLKMANEFPENKIICLCRINFWIGQLHLDGEIFARVREFLGGTGEDMGWG